MDSRKHPHRNDRAIYDVLYGFVPLTEWEEKLINSPFFQRLRWIRQLGFSSFIFPGAEHNRFSHTIGVMHSMDQMVRALGLAVPDEELFDPKCKNEQAMFHKSLRIAALMHDIGTFPFSHAVEYAYIRYGNDNRREGDKLKNLPNSHEHLGSYIIKNTNFDGGITQILEEYGFDIQMISKIIKGDSPYVIANQLMHSDLDADRMDYLIRDAHYTGIKYGHFDREYILANLATFETDEGQMGFGVRESAFHAVENFLISRFSWYSQVIKNRESAKFDIMSTYVADAFLREDHIHQFQDLLTMIDQQDERFFWWNDVYFMSRCQELKYFQKIKDPRIQEWNNMLIYRIPPKAVKHPLFEHRIMESDQKSSARKELLVEVKAKVSEMQDALTQFGKGNEWILADIPEKDVTFTSLGHSGNPLSGKNRDPIRVVSRSGKVTFIMDKSNGLMKTLSGYSNFVPNVYANEAAIELLKSRKLIS